MEWNEWYFKVVSPSSSSFILESFLGLLKAVSVDEYNLKEIPVLVLDRSSNLVFRSGDNVVADELFDSKLVDDGEDIRLIGVRWWEWWFVVDPKFSQPSCVVTGKYSVDNANFDRCFIVAVLPKKPAEFIWTDKCNLNKVKLVILTLFREELLIFLLIWSYFWVVCHCNYIYHVVFRHVSLASIHWNSQCQVRNRL